MKLTDKIKMPGGKVLDFSAGAIIMGIINVTPDSFSDGGKFLEPDRALEQALRQISAGAGIIDIGPESSRPGAEPVPADEQIRRAVPVIEKLAAKTSAVISIDTPLYEVARAALDAGADIINDITGMADGQMVKLAAGSGCPVVIMHMRGNPGNMQKDPVYDDVVEEVAGFLVERGRACEKAGIKKQNIIIDPGIGFGKTAEHNLELLRNTGRFVRTGYRVLIGASRKRFIGQICGKDNPDERLMGTAAVAAINIREGASIVRVHDVEQIADVVKTANAIGPAGA